MRAMLFTLVACFLCSFTVPTRAQFREMTEPQRTKVLEHVWDSRYDIMLNSKADDVVDEFFCIFHEMLLEDKDLCQKEKSLRQE